MGESSALPEYELYPPDTIPDTSFEPAPIPPDKCEGFRLLLKKIQDTRKAQDAIFEVLEKQAKADLDNCLNSK